MPVTIKSIAAEAGVSYQAVSAVLNDKNNCRVSSTTRELIKKIAKERGYHPSFGYKLLRGHSTHTIGIVSAMQSMENEDHIRRLIIQLMHNLNQQGYSTYFNNMMTEDAEENLQQIRNLINRGTEHFVFIGSPLGHQTIEEELTSRNCTFIGWNSSFSRTIQADSFNASLELLTFLRNASGEIPFLVIPESALSNARFKALCVLCNSLTEQEVIERYVVFCSNYNEHTPGDLKSKYFESGYFTTEKLFSSGRCPKAIAYFTDDFALGGVTWCHHHNIITGKDIFISGFNNTNAVKFNPYPISSAAHPIDETMKILMQEIKNTGDFEIKLPLKVYLRTEKTT